MTSTFPFSTDDSFIRAISSALTEAARSTNSEYGQLLGSCGKPWYIWARRNTALKACCEACGSKTHLVQLHNWDYLPIYYDGILYLLMSQSRYHDLQLHPEKSPLHYSKALALVNRDLDGASFSGEQISLFPAPEKTPECQAFQAREVQTLEQFFREKPERYVIVTFCPDGQTGIRNLTAHLVDSDFRELATESWDGAIPGAEDGSLPTAPRPRPYPPQPTQPSNHPRIDEMPRVALTVRTDGRNPAWP